MDLNCDDGGCNQKPFKSNTVITFIYVACVDLLF